MSKSAPDPDYSLRGCDGPVTCLVFPDELDMCQAERWGHNILLCGTERGTILVWDLDRHRLQRQIKAHSSSVLGLYLLTKATDHDGSASHVMSHGRDGLMHKWIIRGMDWTLLESYPCNALGFCAAAVSVVNESFIVAVTRSNQSDIDIINLDQGKTLQRLCPEKFDIKPGMCMTIKLITGDTGLARVLTGYEDGRIALWDTTSETMLCNTIMHPDPVTCIDYSTLLKKGISGSVDQKIKIWMIDHDTWDISSLQHIDITNPGLNCIRFCPDSKLFVTGGWDHAVRVFHGKNSKPLAVLRCHKDSIQCVAFRRGNTLAVGSKDGSISVWNIYK